MTPNELERLIAEEVACAQDAPDETENVVRTDLWTQRRGSEIAERWKDNDVADHNETVVTDAYGSLFEPEVQLEEHPADKQRAAWWKQLTETPEYAALHDSTMLKSQLAELASKQICDQWQEYATENEDEGEDGTEPGSGDEPIGRTIARIKSTSKAVEQAKQDVDDAVNTAAGLGLGDATELDSAEIALWFNRVRNSQFLRDVMRVAGRMRALCSSLQKTKTRHGHDDVVGVELSGDVGRLLPVELAKLCCGIEEIELLATYNVAQRMAMSRKYRGVESLGRGPIVVSVDESSSMSGKRIVAAKALAATLAWLAKRQGRWCALVSFAKGGGENVVLPPGKWDQSALIRWLTHFYAGGTSLDCPCRITPQELWPEFVKEGLARGKTDHVIITDCEVSCPSELAETYKRWASAEQVTTYGIAIGVRAVGDLGKVCDRAWAIANLDMDCDAVKDVLSL